MVMGRSALGQMTQFNLEIVAMALLLHYVLGAIMGMMLAAIMAPFRLDSSVGMEAAIGLAFGIVAYGWNFYVMTAVFPWFVSERGSGLAGQPVVRRGGGHHLRQAGAIAQAERGRLTHRVSRRAANTRRQRETRNPVRAVPVSEMQRGGLWPLR